MFRVSTKGDYGLLLMSALAEKSTDGTARNEFVPLKKIAEEKKLSFSYISQLVIPLKNAGLVESKEGFSGGYRLAKNASEISLMEILEALEGEIAPVKCCNRKMEPCKCAGMCGVQSMWRGAIMLLKKYFSSKKLSDISSGKRAEASAPGTVYFINP